MIKNADFRMTDAKGNKMYFVIGWGEAVTDGIPSGFETSAPPSEATLYLTLIHVTSELDAKLQKANRHLSKRFAGYYPDLLRTCMKDLDAAITNGTFDSTVQVSRHIPNDELERLVD